MHVCTCINVCWRHVTQVGRLYPCRAAAASATIPGSSTSTRPTAAQPCTQRPACSLPMRCASCCESAGWWVVRAGASKSNSRGLSKSAVCPSTRNRQPRRFFLFLGRPSCQLLFFFKLCAYLSGLYVHKTAVQPGVPADMRPYWPGVHSLPNQVGDPRGFCGWVCLRWPCWRCSGWVRIFVFFCFGD